ncbi:MAG TPA: hypothetical protein VEW72_11805 [Burkholderiales bacterium]|nr:hypothetical protein [Burkholderiales bacterium]
MNPLALSATAATVAALLGVALVFLLYLLKPPLRRFLVPSSLIWERVLKQTHAGNDRLRWWLSVLLAALIAVAIVVAVVRPELIPTATGGTKLLLVMDNSPTMATRATDGASRWDHGVARAREVLQAQSAGTRVWLADTMRQIATPGFEDRDSAIERLATLHVAHGGTPRVPLPPAGDGGAGEAQIVVVSDGVQITEVPRAARIESVFEPVQNAGITAFELRPLPANPRRVQAFVEITNGGGSTKEVALALTGLGGRSVARRLEIPANDSRAELLDVSDFDGGPIRASLVMAGDGLADDDNAYAWLPLRRVIRVGLVSEGSPWLEKALRAQPRVILDVTTPARYADRRDVDVWVFDRHAPRMPPAAPSLLFYPGKAGWLPAQTGELENPLVAGWDAGHPLLESISLKDLIVERAQRTVARKEGGDAVLIAAAGGQPLAWVHEQGTRRVSFGFSLEHSNFALHAAFPQFLNNALNWMVSEPILVKAGLGTMELPLADAHVIAADGSELAANAIPGGSLVEIREPGFYTAVSAQQRLRIAANVLDRGTTQINKSSFEPMVVQGHAPVRSPPPPLRPDPWLLLLLAALGLLAFEWWSWNRRVTL